MIRVILIDGHVRSTAQRSIGIACSEQWAANFAWVIEFVADDLRYTALSAVSAAGEFLAQARKERSAFEFGLDCMIRGFGYCT